MIIETVQTKEGKTVQIHIDEYPDNPREWDNLGTMVFFHRRYNVGDDHNFSIEDLNDFIAEEDPIFLYVHGYDHGGLSISTNQFADPWDSGTLGVIYVSKEKVKKEFSWKYLTAPRIEKIKSYLNNEVEIYNDYIQGNVYGYVSTCNYCGAEDSCWGFYGDDWKENGMLEYVGGYCQCVERQYNQLVAIKE